MHPPLFRPHPMCQDVSLSLFQIPSLQSYEPTVTGYSKSNSMSRRTQNRYKIIWKIYDFGANGLSLQENGSITVLVQKPN